MDNKHPLLSSKAYLMRGRQRILCVLELGEDKVVRLYKKRGGSLLFDMPVNTLQYSGGNLVKSRLRLSALVKGNEVGVRLGIGSINQERSSFKSLGMNGDKSSKLTSRQIWINALKKYGTIENPQHPEEKLDRVAGWVFLGSFLIAVFVIVLAMLNTG